MNTSPSEKKFFKYLPSRKFSIIMGSVLGAVIIFLAVSFIFSGKIAFISEKAKSGGDLSVQNKTLSQLVQTDSDGDGVPDWEEALWGTDPHKKATFGGVPDATYIANKKKEMNIEQDNRQNEQNLTETEKFAQEFFSSFAALKASGQVDANTINNFSSALGQKIVEANLPDKYTKKDAKINNTDDLATDENYYQTVKKLFDKHKEEDKLGSEIGIVTSNLTASENSSGSGTGTSDQTASGTTSIPSTAPGNHTELQTIGQSYQNFAKEMLNISVPQSLLSYHLSIANDAYKTGTAVTNMEKITDDPVIGLSGLSQYQKYSSQLVTDVANLQQALMNKQ